MSSGFKRLGEECSSIWKVLAPFAAVALLLLRPGDLARFDDLRRRFAVDRGIADVEFAVSFSRKWTPLIVLFAPSASEVLRGGLVERSRYVRCEGDYMRLDLGGIWCVKHQRRWTALRICKFEGSNMKRDRPEQNVRKGETFFLCVYS